MSRQKEIDVNKLKGEVDNLTEVLGVLSVAFDKMSQSQAIVSDTVNNLVQAQEEFIASQAHLIKEVGETKSGVTELLRRVAPPSSLLSEGE